VSELTLDVTCPLLLSVEQASKLLGGQVLLAYVVASLACAWRAWGMR